MYLNLVSQHIKEQIVLFLRTLATRTITMSNLEGQVLDRTSQPILKDHIVTHEILDMELEADKEYLRQSKYFFPPMNVFLLENLIYCPWYNIILSNSRQVLLDSVGTKKQKKRFSFRRLYLSQVETIPGICIVFRSSTLTHSYNYSHTLIDNASRLWLLGNSDLVHNQEVKILFSSEPTELESFLIDKLLPKNFIVTVVNPHRLYSCEKVLFTPTITKRGASAVPQEYAEFLIDKLGPKRQRSRDKRIFISRSNRGVRSVLNEDELLEVLSMYGFQKFTLEEMSIEKKIELFYDAEYILAPYGAGLANIIFSKNANVIELFPTSFIIPHYYFLSKCLGHHYQYCHGNGNDININFEVDIPTVLNVLNSSRDEN